MSYGQDNGDDYPRQQGLQPRTLILLMVAVGCGLIAALLTSTMTFENEPRKHASTDGFSVVVVAKKEIAAGTAIQEPGEYFKIVHYRPGDEPRDSVKSLEGLKGRVVVRALAEDQPVKDKDLQ